MIIILCTHVSQHFYTGKHTNKLATAVEAKCIKATAQNRPPTHLIIVNYTHRLTLVLRCAVYVRDN